MATQVNLRLDEDLLARLDAARGDVSRNRYIKSAVEMAIARIGQMTRADLGRLPDSSPLLDGRSVHVPGPDVSRYRSSAQSKQGVLPRPKAEPSVRKAR